ncbi:unnamed protein product [Vicia faba]|uniref:BHLH domain-containing protein n=1 Tax=Vicia faba TaxID=3906 RepID=A0AAV1AMU4_VICFA|nr:unnamed protein product [Vicia faba]
MEEIPWGNCSYDLEMDHEVTESLCDTNNTFEEEFLRDIFHQTPQDLFMSLPIDNNNNSSINVSHSTDQHVAEKPSSYILSFDKSSILLPPTQQHIDHLKCSLPLSSKSKANQSSNSRKRRSASETLDHIMAERKRRKEIRMMFIELSAILPGLKKTDKSYKLREAVNYVKQFKERVKELEQDIKKRDKEFVNTLTRSHLFIDNDVAIIGASTGFLEQDIKKRDKESVNTLTRSHLFIDNDVAIGEKKTEESYECNQSLPQVEARVLGKEVLIRVHCVMQKEIVVNIMSQLQLHHLSITTSSILPFRNTLNINIVAQMDDNCNLIVKALVKKLKLVATLQTCDDVQQ